MFSLETDNTGMEFIELEVGWGQGFFAKTVRFSSPTSRSATFCCICNKRLHLMRSAPAEYFSHRNIAQCSKSGSRSDGLFNPSFGRVLETCSSRRSSLNARKSRAQSAAVLAAQQRIPANAARLRPAISAGQDAV